MRDLPHTTHCRVLPPNHVVTLLIHHDRVNWDLTAGADDTPGYVTLASGAVSGPLRRYPRSRPLRTPARARLPSHRDDAQEPSRWSAPPDERP